MREVGGFCGAEALRWLLSHAERSPPPPQGARGEGGVGGRPLVSLGVSAVASFGVSSSGLLLPLTLELVFGGRRLQR